MGGVFQEVAVVAFIYIFSLVKGFHITSEHKFLFAVYAPNSSWQRIGDGAFISQPGRYAKGQE